jgi:hypothetical protein
MLKITVAAQAPTFAAEHTDRGAAGDNLDLTIRETGGTPVVSCHWDFGDGVALDGKNVKHAWTEPGDYTVQVVAAGLDGRAAERHFVMHVTGTVKTGFTPALNQRFEPK